MAGVIQKPDNLSLSGNIKKFILSGNQPVSFILKKEGTVLLESEYIPGTDNLLEIDVRDVVENCLSYKLDTSNDSYTQTDLVASFTATIDSTDYPFRVIRCGVSNLADTASNWLKLHFLTWQPRIKTVTYYSPEWLTYYAVEGCSIQLKAIYPDKTTRVITLHSCSAGTAVTINMQYAVIAGKLGDTYPSYYEVWTEAGSTKLSESQIYAFSDVLSEDEQWYLFENSLGGLDTFRAYGTNNLNAEHEHNIAEFSDVREEYEVDTNRKYTKNTGYLDEYSRRWLLDFFPSRAKYVYESTAIRKIVVTESNVTYISNDIPSSYTFTWQLAEISPFLNLIKDENDIPNNLVAPDLSSPDFILPPRLAEFPRVTLSEGVLIPAFDPFNPKPTVTTYGAIHNTIKNAVVKELEDEIGNIGGGGSGSDLEIIESTDTTTVPSETNVYAALKSKKEDEKRLRKDVADTANKLITFMEGLVSRMKAVLESGADFGVDGSGGHIEATGEAEFLNLFLREYLKTDKIQSQEFHAGALGTGFLIKRDPATGKSYAEVDELFVRIKAFFTELEIKKLSFAGGNWIFSAAGMKCVRVEDKGTFYRCYFTSSDGETSVKNEFRVDDQCRSQEFNIKVGTSQNVSNRYYWRLCIAVGDDYIDLSKADCDTNSDAPVKGDSIVQLGNRTDVARQNAIVISAYGEGSPSITQHKGIKTYSLLGTEKTRISPELNEFTGEFHFMTGENVKDEVSGAKASATAADNKAVAAQGTATAAKNRLDSWASDGVISPTEKVALKTEQADIRAEKLEIVADAVKYNVGATAYVNAYTAYDSDLTYYTYASPENITILPTFATRQSAYYSARTAILAVIATAAKSYVDTGVGSAKSYTDTTFAAVDGKITLAVDSVKIGGTNLLLNTDRIYPTNGREYTGILIPVSTFEVGKTYTWSFDLKIEGNFPPPFTQVYHQQWGGVIQIPVTPINTTQNWARYSVTFVWKSAVITSPASNIEMSFYCSYDSGSYPRVRRPKLEEGNKATAWSPAPEDQTDYADNAANTVRTETNTKLEVLDGKISQTVTKTEFNEMQIGGRNLIRKSKEVTQPATSSNWNYAMHGITQVKPGTIYIFSVDKSVINSGPDASAFSVLIYDATTNTNMASASVPISIDRQIVKLQTTPTLNVNNNIQLLIYTGPAGAASNRGMSFYNVKLEEGNKATAWSSAPEDLVQESKDYANATFPTKTVYESAITQLSDKIELKVSKTEYSAGLSDAAIIASISPDMMLNTDPTFKKGYNGTVLYGSPNNSYARMPLAGLPNDSGYCLKIMNTGASSAGLGGFGFATWLVANVAFVTKIVAKIPAGYGINWASNGGYGERRWLTSNLGDGTWREYIYYVKSLPSGTFNTTNFFYLSGTPGVDWYVAFATVYRLNSYQSYPTTTEYQTKITQLEDSISFKASRNDVTALTDRVTQAEIKLQPDNIWLGISDKTVAVTRKTVDLTALNQNTYYPVTFAITGYTDKLLTISAGRNLNSAYGLPAWSTHSSGFSLIVKWSTNASGWGTIAVQRQILEYTTSHVTTGTIPAGSINQMTNSSIEYIYLRGGSKYDIVVEGGNNIDIQLRTSSFTSNSQTIAPASSVVQPVPELDQKSNTSDLLATGINLTTKQITVTAPTFRVQDNAGTPIAVFTTNAAGKPVLRADNIDVDNLAVKKLDGATGTFTGYLKTPFIPLESSDAVYTGTWGYRLETNLYVKTNTHDILLPCHQRYDGVTAAIFNDTWWPFTKTFTGTYVRTENGEKIFCYDNVSQLAGEDDYKSSICVSSGVARFMAVWAYYRNSSGNNVYGIRWVLLK